MNEGGYAALTIPKLTRPGCMNAIAQLGHAPQSFEHHLHSARYAFALPRLDNGGGTQRQQTDHGTNFEAPCTTIGKAEDIVIESILLVPHPLRSGLVHGVGDPEEMVSKLDRH